jgi:16S rRNA G966 N2-methylase RsmD
MLTKTIKFDDDVLGVFEAMEWRDNGLLGIIAGGQLERDLYMRCNKAFDALGGKWNRKAGGIVFSTDPRMQIEGLIENGALTIERDGFFETPRTVVERMIEFVPTDNRNDALTLEPSAGIGAIARILREHGTQCLIMFEKNEQRYDALLAEFTSQDISISHADFLNYHPTVEDYRFDRIYMNPPFEELQDIDHVKHAYELLADDGAMVSVMSESSFFRNDKKAVEFRSWLENVGSWSEKLPEGAFKESGTGVNARLVVIEK